MKIVRLITACIAFTVWVSTSAVAEQPRHSFVRTYDQMLDELPNVKSKLVESSVDGIKRWNGSMSVGSATVAIRIRGENKNAVTALTVILLATPSTTESDYRNAEALRNVLFQGLLGGGAPLDLVNDFFVHELTRQEQILKAGGQPKRGVQRMAQGASEASLELDKVSRGFIAIYAIKML